MKYVKPKVNLKKNNRDHRLQRLRVQEMMCRFKVKYQPKKQRRQNSWKKPRKRRKKVSLSSYQNSRSNLDKNRRNLKIKMLRMRNSRNATMI